MSVKDPTHSTQVPAFQLNFRNRSALLGFSIALLAIIALGFILRQSESSQVSEASAAPAAVTVPHGNGMEMQYAQPWLARSERASTVPYSSALEMLYAQPWLETNSSDTAAAAEPAFYTRYWEMAADAAARSATD